MSCMRGWSRCKRVEDLADVSLDQEVTGTLHPDRMGVLKGRDPILGVGRGRNRVSPPVDHVDGDADLGRVNAPRRGPRSGRSITTCRRR